MKEAQVKLSRRPLLVGAGVVGALAAVTAVVKTPSDAPAETAALEPAPARGGGYRESEHVKRYYQTTRI